MTWYLAVTLREKPFHFGKGGGYGKTILTHLITQLQLIYLLSTNKIPPLAYEPAFYLSPSKNKMAALKKVDLGEGK